MRQCTANIIQNFNGEILLLKRSPEDDFHPSTWCLPGGCVDDGEKPLDGVKRETYEESGIQDTTYDILSKKTIKLKDVTIHYFLSRENTEVDGFVFLDNNEHCNYEWCDHNNWKDKDLILDLKQHLTDIMEIDKLEKAIVIPKHIKQGIDKRGHIYVRKVNDEQVPKASSKTPVIKLKSGSESKIKVGREAHWSDEFKKYNLNKYPVGIDKKDVTFNLEGDINSHSIMKWKDPKSGKQQDAYTKEFLQRNAEHKWERIKTVNSKIITSIKTKADRALASEDDKQQQCGAIIKIIALSGLRIGQKVEFNKTGNRGVSTLAPENLKVVGDEIWMSFVGKSYKENSSVITDAGLAKYLKKRKATAVKNKSEFLFDYDRKPVDGVFKNDFGFKGLKLKDMRTYIATSLAKDILYEDKNFAKTLTGDDKSNKKLIQKKLNDCDVRVSQVLNNTPKMARDSYIHPAIKHDWLIQLGVNVEEFKKSMDIDLLTLQNPTLDEIIKRSNFATRKNIKIDEDEAENCDVYPMDDWESENDNIEKSI